MPQSICTRYGLAVGYYASWLLRVLMVISFPIAWPLGKLLDIILGHSAATLPRGQLQQYVTLHGEDEGFAALGEALTRNETQIINSALELSSKTARAAMTPLDKVFMVASDAVLDEVLCQEIIRVGHSRVPVHAPGDRASILGLLLVKELLLVKVRPYPRPVDTPLWHPSSWCGKSPSPVLWALLYGAPRWAAVWLYCCCVAVLLCGG